MYRAIPSAPYIPILAIFLHNYLEGLPSVDLLSVACVVILEVDYKSGKESPSNAKLGKLPRSVSKVKVLKLRCQVRP